MKNDYKTYEFRLEKDHKNCLITVGTHDFVAKGALIKMEHLLRLWEDEVHVCLSYNDNDLTFTIKENTHKNNNYHAFKCLERDFPVEHAEQFRQTMDIFSFIADILLC